MSMQRSERGDALRKGSALRRVENAAFEAAWIGITEAQALDAVHRAFLQVTEQQSDNSKK